MVTTCLLGSDPAVSVRPFWTKEAFETDFLQRLNDWGDLTAIRLDTGDAAVLKLSRHLYKGHVHTWLALYYPAGAYESDRKYTCIGAGFLLVDRQTVPGDLAFKYLDDVLTVFSHAYAPDGKLMQRIDALSTEELRVPKSVADLDNALFERAEGSGLSARTRKGAGGILFLDLAGQTDRDHIANLLDRCQADPRFEPYHTVLMGAAPDVSKKLVRLDVATPEDFFSRPPPRPLPSPPQDDRPAGTRVVVRTGGDGPMITPSYARASQARSSGASGESGFYRGLVFGGVGTALFLLLFGYLVLIGRGMLQREERPPWAQGQANDAPGASASNEANGVSPDDARAADLRRAEEAVIGYFTALRAGDEQAATRLWTRRSGERETARTTRRLAEAGQRPVRVIGVDLLSPAQNGVLAARARIEIIDSDGASREGVVDLLRLPADSDWLINAIQLRDSIR